MISDTYRICLTVRSTENEHKYGETTPQVTCRLPWCTCKSKQTYLSSYTFCCTVCWYSTRPLPPMSKHKGANHWRNTGVISPLIHTSVLYLLFTRLLCLIYVHHGVSWGEDTPATSFVFNLPNKKSCSGQCIFLGSKWKLETGKITEDLLWISDTTLASLMLLPTFRQTQSPCHYKATKSYILLRSSLPCASVCWLLSCLTQPAGTGSSRCDVTFPSRSVGLSQSGLLSYNMSWPHSRRCFLMQSD